MGISTLSAKKMIRKLSQVVLLLVLYVLEKTLIKIGGFDKNFRRYEDLDLAIRSLMNNIL